MSTLVPSLADPKILATFSNTHVGESVKLAVSDFLNEKYRGGTLVICYTNLIGVFYGVVTALPQRFILMDFTVCDPETIKLQQSIVNYASRASDHRGDELKDIIFLSRQLPTVVNPSPENDVVEPSASDTLHAQKKVKFNSQPVVLPTYTGTFQIPMNASQQYTISAPNYRPPHPSVTSSCGVQYGVIPTPFVPEFIAKPDLSPDIFKEAFYEASIPCCLVTTLRYWY